MPKETKVTSPVRVSKVRALGSRDDYVKSTGNRETKVMPYKRETKVRLNE